MKRITILLLTILCVIPSFTQTMEWHIKDNYVDIKYMGNNLFKVKNTSGKWGIINEYGQLTVAMQYDSITPIVESRSLLLDNRGGLQGIVNEDGQVIKSFYSGEVIANYPYFNEGMLAFGIPAGQYYNYGYLDMYGTVCIEPKYFWAAPFSDGKAVVRYKSRRFGLIDKSGGSALNDNRNIKFISTPVNNSSLIAVASNRGDKVLLVTLEPYGKLDETEELESGITVRIPDFKSISCVPNGHAYYFDDAMRLVSSSTGKKFNEPLVYNPALSSNSKLKKMRELGGWKILHSGNTLVQSSFREISFCGNEYAIVTTQRNTMGVLKLNQNGNIFIQNIPSKVEFYHNTTVKGNMAVNINGLLPSSEVQIGIVGLKENQQEEIFPVPTGFNGIYNQPLSFFIPATSFDSEVGLPIKVNLYIDGMLYKTEDKELSGVHKRSFRISEATAPEYSDSEGNATITFNVQSLESEPSSTAKVIISGASHQSRRFNGTESLHFEVPVKVPVESEKTYSLTVTVKEDGCPSYTRIISKTIKHYDLQ